MFCASQNLLQHMITLMRSINSQDLDEDFFYKHAWYSKIQMQNPGTVVY